MRQDQTPSREPRRPMAAVPLSRGELAERLRLRAARARLDVSGRLLDDLVSYVELLHRWNARMNLTGLGAGDEGLDRLIVEPLAAARHVANPAPRIIDIGSGGGSPAIPLRLALGGWLAADGRGQGAQGRLSARGREAPRPGGHRRGGPALRGAGRPAVVAGRVRPADGARGAGGCRGTAPLADSPERWRGALPLHRTARGGAAGRCGAAAGAARDLSAGPEPAQPPRGAAQGVRANPEA